MEFPAPVFCERNPVLTSSRANLVDDGTDIIDKSKEMKF
jgi:hypothetical protein